jgi:hypothetical protein
LWWKTKPLIDFKGFWFLRNMHKWQLVYLIRCITSMHYCILFIFCQCMNCCL